MVNNRRSFAKSVFAALLLVGLYYNSYRYPFQIGDTRTSPTYSDTPIVIQIVKYILLSILLTLSFVVIRKELVRYKISELVVLVFVISSIVVCALIGAYELNIAIRLFEIGFFLLFLIAFSSSDTYQWTAQTLVTYIKMFLVLDIISIISQLILYFAYARLPALGYDGGNVRFGGIWDDPNSALVPMVLLLPYFAVKEGLSRSTILVGLATVVTIVLSQSVTATIALALSVIIVFVFYYRSIDAISKLFILLRVSTILPALVIGVAFSYLVISGKPIWQIVQVIDEALSIKVQSAQLRSTSYNFVENAGLATYLGLDPVMAAGENQYVNILLNLGAPLLVFYILIHGYVLTAFFRWAKFAKGEEHAVAIGFATYYLWYAIGMINIPFAEVFPTNLLAMIVAGIAIGAEQSRKARSTRALTLHPRPS